MGIEKLLLRLSFALQRKITPGLVYSQTAYETALHSKLAEVSSWLDVGCGHQLLPDWRRNSEETILQACPLVIGIDLDFESLKRHQSFRHKICGSVSNLPFDDESFDLVTANMVVEHLEHPEIQFLEIRRVLKHGGRFIFHTPNDRSYLIRVARIFPDRAKRLFARLLEGRREEDIFTTHYLANNADKIRDLCSVSGLELEEMIFIRTSPLLNRVPPLLLIELFWIRALGSPKRAKYRTNIICVLRKGQVPSP